MSTEAQPAEKTERELLVMVYDQLRGLRSDLRRYLGPEGDPIIGRNPPKWKGQSFEGRRASECPQDFLECYAEFAYFRGENPREGKEKYAAAALREAALCSRWAMVNRGKVAESQTSNFRRPVAPATAAAPEANTAASKPDDAPQPQKKWGVGGWSKPANGA